MVETDEKLLPAADERPRIEPPAEEKLRAEIEALRREVQQLRENGARHTGHPVRPRRRTLWIIGILLGATLLLGFFLGWLPRHRRETQLRSEAQREQHALPRLNFVRTQPSGKTEELILPGTTEALLDAPILARADGYVVNRFVDIGDRVKKGQLMAVIAAPDLDQQVLQARAQLSQSEAALKQANSSLQQGKANAELARVTAARYRNLVVRGAVARQDNDTQQTNYQAQISNVGALEQAESAAAQNVQAAQANLQRLIELQSFERVTAPFDGLVTLRNIDVGALITTGSTLLFRVGQTDVLRTYIDVPQPNAPSIAVGETAQLQSTEFRDRAFAGRVTRTAGALDPSTRTLVTEVQVPNPQGILRPGMFVDVKLENQRVNPPILVPGDSIVIDSGGARVAILRNTQRVQPEPDNNQQAGSRQQKDGKQSQNQNQNQSRKQQKETVTGTIHLQPVSIGRDYGAATEILAGLSVGQIILTNPNDAVREGVKVEATEEQAILDVQSGNSQQARTNANTEKLQPVPGGESMPKQPSKMNKKRGPGY